MNEVDLKTLKALIIKNSMFYRDPLPDEMVQMHAEDLSDLPIDKITAAYSALRRIPKTRSMPLPADVRALIEPSEPTTAADEARIIAAKIMSAVAKFGWPNQNEAKQFLGELCWEVVKLQGGWPRLCEALNEGNMGTSQAQLRDLATSVIRFRPKQPEQKQIESDHAKIDELTPLV